MSEPSYIEIPNWERFQHYKDRDPIWIKSYTKLLSHDEYLALSGHRRAILHGIWLAYATSTRRLRGDTLTLSRRLSLKVSTSDMESLIHAGFITVSASKTLAQVENPASDVLPQSKSKKKIEKKENVKTSPMDGEPSQNDATSQTLVASFVDQSRKKGANPPSRIIGQVAKETKLLLADGTNPQTIQRAYAILLERGLHPSTLASCVQQVSLNGSAGKQSLLTPFQRAKQWVINGGWECPDHSLWEELGRFGLEGDEKKSLVEMAMTKQEEASGRPVGT